MQRDTTKRDTTYTTPQVAALTHATQRQLDYWDQVGLVSPSVQAQGSGTQRGYTPQDVARVALVLALLELGLSLQAIRKGVSRWGWGDIESCLMEIRSGVDQLHILTEAVA